MIEPINSALKTINTQIDYMSVLANQLDGEYAQTRVWARRAIAAFTDAYAFVEACGLGIDIVSARIDAANAKAAETAAKTSEPAGEGVTAAEKSILTPTTATDR